MNRRHFIFTLPVLAALPLLTTKTITANQLYAKPASACKYLTELYNKACKGTGFAHIPKFIYSGQALFEQFESELPIVTRFCDMSDTECGYKVLAFKSGKYRASHKLAPYEVVFAGAPIVGL